MTMRPIPIALTIVAAVGVAGAALNLAAVDSPATGPLTLLFLLLTPALTVAWLLPGLTPLARAIVAGSMSIVVNGAVAQVMLSFDMWAPRRGVAGVAIICALLALTALALSRRPANGTQPAEPPEDEEWLFEG